MKYKVSCDGKESSCTAKDVHTVIDRYDNKNKYVDWIEDDKGVIIVERLKPSVVTAQDLKGWD